MFADYSEEIPTQGAVAVAGIATGDIERSPDRDWFAVELVAGRSCRFDLQGIPGGGTLADACPRASDDSPARFQSRGYNHDGGRDSRVAFTANATGTRYVKAPAGYDETGTCTLAVADVSPTDALPVPGLAVAGGTSARVRRLASHHDNGDDGNRRREVTEQPAGDAAVGVSLTARR